VRRPAKKKKQGVPIASRIETPSPVLSEMQLVMLIVTGQELVRDDALCGLIFLGGKNYAAML
jgi:hypothetical protein